MDSASSSAAGSAGVRDLIRERPDAADVADDAHRDELPGDLERVERAARGALREPLGEALDAGRVAEEGPAELERLDRR